MKSSPAHDARRILRALLVVAPLATVLAVSLSVDPAAAQTRPALTANVDALGRAPYQATVR